MQKTNASGRRGRALVSAVIVFTTAIALLLFSVGCKRKAAEQSAITVGVVLPISGREAKPGQYQREGIELAIKQINDGGGIFVKDLNKKLPVKEIFYEDRKSVV